MKDKRRGDEMRGEERRGRGGDMLVHKVIEYLKFLAFARSEIVNLTLQGISLNKYKKNDH